MTPEKFIIYSKPNCQFCDMSKALLRSKDIPYDEVVMDVGQPKLPDVRYASRDEVLATFPGARTMPQIMAVAGTTSSIVGGYAELKSLLS